MKKIIMGTGLGIAVTTMVATAISASVVNKAKKAGITERENMSKDLAEARVRISELYGRLDGLDSLIKQNNEMMEKNKAEKKALEIDRENIEKEKTKIAEAKAVILDGVDALKNAMYCNNITTRDQLVTKNCEKITLTVTKIDREMEFYKIFAGYGKDFAWVEGNAEAVGKRLEENPGDLETTMQLLGYTEKEKQILRWCFAK